MQIKFFSILLFVCLAINSIAQMGGQSPYQEEAEKVHMILQKIPNFNNLLTNELKVTIGSSPTKKTVTYGAVLAPQDSFNIQIAWTYGQLELPHTFLRYEIYGSDDIGIMLDIKNINTSMYQAGGVAEKLFNSNLYALTPSPVEMAAALFSGEIFLYLRHGYKDTYSEDEILDREKFLLLHAQERALWAILISRINEITTGSVKLAKKEGWYQIYKSSIDSINETRLLSSQGPVQDITDLSKQEINTIAGYILKL